MRATSVVRVYAGSNRSVTSAGKEMETFEQDVNPFVPWLLCVGYLWKIFSRWKIRAERLRTAFYRYKGGILRGWSNIVYVLATIVSLYVVVELSKRGRRIFIFATSGYEWYFE